MKKSKLVTIGLIGLVALSVASCNHKHHHRDRKDWEDANQNPQANVSTDGGRYYGTGNNFWFWMYMMRGSHGWGGDIIQALLIQHITTIMEEVQDSDQQVQVDQFLLLEEEV